MMTSDPSGPAIVANLQKNIEAMSAVDIPKYKVCILCHIISDILTMGTKVGIFIGKNYI